MSTLLADGFNVARALGMGLVGAGVALAVAYGRLRRARRDQQATAAPGGNESVWPMLGVLLLALALAFGGIFLWLSNQ